MSALVNNEPVLEQLEAEFAHNLCLWPLPSEIDVAELLAPALSRTGLDPVCRTTRIKSRFGGCCG